MRSSSLCGLLLIWSCTGAVDGGEKDPSQPDPPADTDLTANDTDSPGADIPVYEPVLHAMEIRRTSVDGGDIAYHHVEEPLGIVWAFHGTGGSVNIVDTAEMTEHLNAWHAQNLSFVLLTSEDRSSGRFDTGRPPADNIDFQRVSTVMTQLIDNGAISADIPVFTWGFSAGGGFANYVAHAGLAEGWSIKGVVAHETRAKSNQYGDLPLVPCIFSPAVNDPLVRFEAMESDFASRPEGLGDVWLPSTEQALHPTRFARVDYITPRDSRDLVRASRDLGYFDDGGWRVFSTEGIEDTLDEIIEALDPQYPKPVTGQLKTVLAMHSINGQNALEEAEVLAGWAR